MNIASLPADLNFETAMRELEGIVRKLEQGTVDLEQSMQDYERGMQLKSFCDAKLAEAQLKVEALSKAPDGSVQATPFAMEAGASS
jgi:exodeoxyribonuclease VII small subunit